MRRFPFAADPAGWYQVAYSSDLAPGAVVPIEAFEQELVAYRGANDGQVRVFDAYCPHLGAHLGHGGTVEGDCIRCPFHGWRFAGDGGCVEIPDGSRIPPLARARTHHAREVAGLVLVYHGPEPSWHPDLPALDDERWVPSYHTRHWRIRSHVQDVAENLVDAAHFHVVHRTATRPVVEVEPRGSLFKAQSRMGMHTPRGVADVTLDIEALGLGLAMIRFRGICDTLLILGLTPVGDDRIDLRLSFRVARDASPDRGVGAALIADVVKQTEEDIRIWERKIYRDRPALCASDKPVAAMRAWAKQFYAASTPGGLAPATLSQ